MLSLVVSPTATVGSVNPLNRLFVSHFDVLIEASLKSSSSNTVSPPDGALYVNAFALLPLCPFEFVTATSTVPALCAGVVAVIVVLLVTTTPLAAVPPTVTVAPAAKPVPVIVICVPPVVGPDVGETVETVGAGVDEV